jgi:predicted metal-dependent enzyme (double-stranded beta helix superfamily)
MASVAELVARCLAAARTDHPIDAVRDVLQDVVARPALWQAMFEREVHQTDHRGISELHEDARLTITHVALDPDFVSGVHDHGIPALIAVYSGQEDNTFYRLADGVPVADRHTAVVAPDILFMATEDIHHIENRLAEPLRAVHIYFGSLPNAVRSAWNMETGERMPRGGSPGAPAA